MNATFAYDPLDRLVSAAAGSVARAYAYDANGNRTRRDIGTGSTPYAYEARSNRLHQVGPNTVALDPNGNTVQSGTSTYRYTTLNRLREARVGGTLVATYTYNGLGQRSAKILADGTRREFVYSAAGALFAERDGAGHILAEYVYLNGGPLAKYEPDTDHDGLTNLQEKRQFGSDLDRADTDGDTLPDGTEALVYATDPLKADTDGDGIRDDAEITAGTDPLLASSYPGDGDVTENGAVDAGDYLVLTRIVLHLRAPSASERIHGDLNSDGLLDTRDLLLLARRILHLATSPTPAPTTVHRTRRSPLRLAAAGAPTAIAPPSGNGRIYFYHNDHLGTPLVLTDENATPVWRADYTPFGHATFNEDPDANAIRVTNPVRFPGQYYDSETGLRYNYYRYYDPQLGRYVSPDPIGLAGGLNAYAYVGGNPIMFFDSLGLFPTCDSTIIGVFDVVSTRTAEQVLSRDYGFAFVITGPSVSPNLDPRSSRRPPIKPSLRTEVWWALKELLSIKTFELRKTFQRLKVFCTETLTDECGNTRGFRTNFERTELINEIERLTGERIETREQLLRPLFVLDL